MFETVVVVEIEVGALCVTEVLFSVAVTGTETMHVIIINANTNVLPIRVNTDFKFGALLLFAPIKKKKSWCTGMPRFRR